MIENKLFLSTCFQWHFIVTKTNTDISTTNGGTVIDMAMWHLWLMIFCRGKMGYFRTLDNKSQISAQSLVNCWGTIDNNVQLDANEGNLDCDTSE